MTREEAKDIIVNTAFFGRKPDDIYTAIGMAADALENENAVINKVLEIIDRNSSVIIDKTALKWIRAEVQALQEEQG